MKKEGFTCQGGTLPNKNDNNFGHFSALMSVVFYVWPWYTNAISINYWLFSDLYDSYISHSNL